MVTDPAIPRLGVLNPVAPVSGGARSSLESRQLDFKTESIPKLQKNAKFQRSLSEEDQRIAFT
uniref:Uncharacterized protein n=1 Tax=Oryza glumipatula TaxID=40148 RepID=A0A0E0BMH6_9ORYZ